MKISEHANYLLNEYGRLQFDYAAYCKPYGEALRNEARNNLEEYIAELEAFIDQLIEAGKGLLDSLCTDPEEDKTVEVMNWKAVVDKVNKEREKNG